MMNSYPRTYLATAVRFCVNPALSGEVEESEAMRQHTLQVLQELEARRPKVVLIPDDQNPYDPYAVQVMLDGHRVALLSKDDARHCQAVMRQLRVPYLLADVGEVAVGEHGFFRVQAADAEVREGSLPDVWADWQPVVSDEIPDLFDHAPFGRSLSLRAMLSVEFQGVENSDSSSSSSASGSSSPSSASGSSISSSASGSSISSSASSSSSSSSASSSSEAPCPSKKSESLGNAVPSPFTGFFQLLDEWLDSMRGDSSLEAQLSLLRCRQRLAASGRAELRQKAAEVEHWMVKWGSDEAIRELCARWQAGFELPYVRRQWQRVLRRTSNLMGLLELVESQLRGLPGCLYDVIDDDFGFFRHLYYLAPPRQKLLRLLSLRLLRTLLCRQLGVGEEPSWKEERFSSQASAVQQGQVVSQASAMQQGQPSIVPSVQAQATIESPLYLSPKRGVKIDFLRVVNAFYETGRFTDKDGAPIPKSKVFMALGRAVNLDLSRYDKDLSRCGTEGTSRVRQLEIFQELLKKQAEIYRLQLG